MKLLTILATGAALLLSQAAAAPVEQASGNASNSSANSPSTMSAADYGSPQCKNAAIFDLCTANNANAYCDGTGFHNNFMTSCKGVCWCG